MTTKRTQKSILATVASFRDRVTDTVLIDDAWQRFVAVADISEEFDALDVECNDKDTYRRKYAHRALGELAASIQDELGAIAYTMDEVTSDLWERYAAEKSAA